MNGVKPCPFCGEKDMIHSQPVTEYDDKFTYKMICVQCTATGPVTLMKEASDDILRVKKMAIKEWNKRISN